MLFSKVDLAAVLSQDDYHYLLLMLGIAAEKPDPDAKKVPKLSAKIRESRFLSRSDFKTLMNLLSLVSLNDMANHRMSPEDIINTGVMLNNLKNL